MRSIRSQLITYGALAAAMLIATATPASAALVLSGGLASADTVITIEADEQAPRLTSLMFPGIDRWTNRAAEPLPSQVEVAGAPRRLTWRLDRSASHLNAQRIELVYVCDAPHLRAVWAWRRRAAHGPIEHDISIQNLSQDEAWLPLQASLRFDWSVDVRTALQRFWVEKGADVPSAQGTHLDALREGDTWRGASSTYARPIAGQPREMIPYLLVTEPGGELRGWYIGIEFSGRTQITLRRTGASVAGDAGLDPRPGPYRTRLPAGATFTTPTIFLGALAGDPDEAGNVLRQWVREVLNSPQSLRDPHYPQLVSNSWGSGMAVDEALAHRMIVDAADLGLEMFHLDAGWFRAVGDWHADPVKFPHGIAGLADFAHQHRLKFGLWVDWTQAGISREPGALDAYDPRTRDWLIADPPPGWKHAEPFKGITRDLGLPAARMWAEGELERIVSSYHLDMLEHDGYLVAQGSTRTNHPAAPPDVGTARVYEDSGYVWADGSNSTDVSYHATRAYYQLYAQLRARHPQLLLEICNDGGRMVDFGSAAHGDYFSITDSYDPLSNRRAFYDASYVLPPAMLEAYVAEWPTPHIENFRYLLRSGMQGWFSLMLDTSHWSAQQRAEARAQFALYKAALRPLLREARLYHVSSRPDGVHWDGIEYYSPHLARGVLYAFRGSAPGEATHYFPLRGLEAAARYVLEYQDAHRTERVGGEALMRQGIAVNLAEPLSSELVFITRQR